MAKVDKQKMTALIEKGGQKKAPPRKPTGGSGPPTQHHKEEAEHEGESAEHEQQEHETDLDEIVKTQGERVQNGDGDNDLMEKMKGYDPDVDGNPPSWVDDEEAWDRAKAAVEPYWENYNEPWAVVAHVYQQMT